MQILVEFNSIIHAVWFGMLFLPDIVGWVLKKVWGMYSLLTHISKKKYTKLW